jgi:hypothetical protein
MIGNFPYLLFQGMVFRLIGQRHGSDEGTKSNHQTDWRYHVLAAQLAAYRVARTHSTKNRWTWT